MQIPDDVMRGSQVPHHVINMIDYRVGHELAYPASLQCLHAKAKENEPVEPNTTIDLDGFAREVREFVRANLPDDIREASVNNIPPSREHARRWQRILDAHGWGAPSWPLEHGGTGWTLTQYATFLRECAMADCPQADNLGLTTVGAAIVRFGTPAQREIFLPAIRRFDDYWALGFSEPDAGSDLTSLITQARPDGDAYVLSGRKIWVSHTQWANRLFVLARTERGARRQEGMSVLLVDKDTPGVSVRPLRYINGTVLHSEILFDDARVPADRLLGAAGGGWEIARHMLVEERLFLARLPECERNLARLAAMGQRRGGDGRRLDDEPWFRRRVIEMCMRFDGYASAWWDTVARAQRGQDASLASSVYRLVGTAVLQDLTEQQLDAAGEAGLAVDPQALEGSVSADPVDAGRAETVHLHHLRYRGITLGAGTSEIQRGIIARTLFSAGRVPLDDPEPELKSVAEAARRFTAGEYDIERRRSIVAAGGHDADAWRDLAELGLFGALVPEALGGTGLDAEGLAEMAVPIGAALIVEPWYWTSALTAAAQRHAPGNLPAGLIDGSRIVALACSERGVRSDPYKFRVPAVADGAGWRVTVDLSPVWGGSVAAEIWLPVRFADGTSAVVRFDTSAPSVQRREFRTYDGRASCVASLRSHRFTAQDIVVAGEGADRMINDTLDIASLCECAEVVGAMQRALDITIEHLHVRKQFGKALAEFQVLQHRVADHYVRLVQLLAFVRAASRSLAANGVDAQARIAAAKWAAARYGRIVGHDVLQLHGAIGLQDETPISHYAKRMMASATMLGDAEMQIDRYDEAWRAGQVPNSARITTTEVLA